MNSKLLFLVCLIGIIQIVNSCRCSTTIDMYYSLRTTNTALVVTIVGKSAGDKPDSVIYKGVVSQVYNGCFENNTAIQIFSTNQTSMCGVSLEVEQEYFITGYANDNGVSVNTCNFNALATDSSIDYKFLGNWYNSCTKSCAVGSVYNCFIDPCDTSSCGDSGAVCYSNYCNGCNAYWWDTTNHIACYGPSM